MNDIPALPLEAPFMTVSAKYKLRNIPIASVLLQGSKRLGWPGICRSTLALALIAFWLVLCGPAAMAQKSSAKSNQPDVLVLVFSIPGGPDQIGLTYRDTVPHAQAQRDIQAIKTATGWNISGVHIADMLPPIKNSKQKMTSVDFVVQGAIDPKLRYLPIEPFVNALRSYHHVTVTYLINYEYKFEGLRQYADNHVKIALEQRGSTYTYQINYHDGRFGHLDLPRYQLANTDAMSAKRAPRRNRVNPWLIALVGVAAVGAGLIVYTVFARNA